MNKKGFTLIELIMTIVLISIVATLSIQIVSKRIKDSKNKAYNVIVSEIVDASKKYMLENNEVDKYHLNTLCISVSTLQNKGYLEKGQIKDPRTKNNLEGYVEVKFDGKAYSYNYTDGCTEKIVTPIIDGILAKETPKIISSGDGLYETNDSYIYKGQNPNNYIKFNNVLWRIVSIDKETGMVKIVNLNGDAVSLKEDLVSGIVTDLNNTYNITYSSTLDLINTNSKFYEGYIDSLDTSLSIKSQEKQITNYHTVSLLSVGDFIDASLDKECYINNNCNSYLKTNQTYWLINKTSDKTKNWYVDSNLKNVTPNSQLYRVYPVLYLKLNIEINEETGNGTELNPYIINS